MSVLKSLLISLFVLSPAFAQSVEELEGELRRLQLKYEQTRSATVKSEGRTAAHKHYRGLYARASRSTRRLTAALNEFRRTKEGLEAPFAKVNAVKTASSREEIRQAVSLAFQVRSHIDAARNLLAGSRQVALSATSGLSAVIPELTREDIDERIPPPGNRLDPLYLEGFREVERRIREEDRKVIIGFKEALETGDRLVQAVDVLLRKLDRSDNQLASYLAAAPAELSAAIYKELKEQYFADFQRIDFLFDISDLFSSLKLEVQKEVLVNRDFFAALEAIFTWSTATHMIREEVLPQLSDAELKGDLEVLVAHSQEDIERIAGIVKGFNPVAEAEKRISALKAQGDTEKAKELELLLEIAKALEGDGTFLLQLILSLAK